MIAGLNELSRFWGEFAVVSAICLVCWVQSQLWERGKQGELDWQPAKQENCTNIGSNISVGIGICIGIGETIMQNLGHLSSIGGGNSFVFFLSCRWTQLR